MKELQRVNAKLHTERGKIDATVADLKNEIKSLSKQLKERGPTYSEVLEEVARRKQQAKNG